MTTNHQQRRPINRSWSPDRGIQWGLGIPVLNRLYTGLELAVVGREHQVCNAVRIMALSRILLSRRTARYSGFRDNRAGIKVHATTLPPLPTPIYGVLAVVTRWDCARRTRRFNAFNEQPFPSARSSERLSNVNYNFLCPSASNVRFLRHETCRRTWEKSLRALTVFVYSASLINKTEIFKFFFFFYR